MYFSLFFFYVLFFFFIRFPVQPAARSLDVGVIFVLFQHFFQLVRSPASPGSRVIASALAHIFVLSSRRYFSMSRTGRAFCFHLRY